MFSICIKLFSSHVLLFYYLEQERAPKTSGKQHQPLLAKRMNSPVLAVAVTKVIVIAAVFNC
jgi:hypothetical protein